MVKTIKAIKKEKKILLVQFKKLAKEEVKLKNDIEMGKEGSKRMTVSTIKKKEAKRKVVNTKINAMRRKIWKLEDAIEKA